MPDESRPRILLCNDDGIFAGGIRALAARMTEVGQIDVVAPNAQQSAVGHALTVSSPLRVERYEHNGEFFGRAVNGTPADCVKLAVTHLLGYRPDLLVSGINHGRNTATSLVYSGTVSGATEGTMLGIPSIAISYDDLARDADFSAAAEIAVEVARWVLKAGLPPGVLLNVNVPRLPLEEIRGIRVAVQGTSYWNDRYDERVDPIGTPYYWLHGEYVLDGSGTDDHALAEGFVSVTPVHYRLTAHDQLDGIRGIERDDQKPGEQEPGRPEA